MTERQPTRKELLRPLHLLAIAAVAGLFAAVVTLVTTGAFTDRVNEMIAAGEYNGLPPVLLALVVGGIAFIVTLLLLSILLLAVDPSQVSRPMDRPVLYDGADADADADAVPDAGGADAESEKGPAGT